MDEFIFYKILEKEIEENDDILTKAMKKKQELLAKKNLLLQDINKKGYIVDKSGNLKLIKSNYGIEANLIFGEYINDAEGTQYHNVYAKVAISEQKFNLYRNILFNLSKFIEISQEITDTEIFISNSSLKEINKLIEKEYNQKIDIELPVDDKSLVKEQIIYLSELKNKMFSYDLNVKENYLKETYSKLQDFIYQSNQDIFKFEHNSYERKEKGLTQLSTIEFINISSDIEDEFREKFVS